MSTLLVLSAPTSKNQQHAILEIISFYCGHHKILNSLVAVRKSLDSSSKDHHLPRNNILIKTIDSLLQYIDCYLGPHPNKDAGSLGRDFTEWLDEKGYRIPFRIVAMRGQRYTTIGHNARSSLQFREWMREYLHRGEHDPHYI
eukprot:TRINITY_DN34291_c0_g1_i1.p1 TRINITY_DN34291_c0_g1~~TRINITY_DN34291_c0_g1_i1.p1  ORF type:complete len:143 (-),score=16.77 TRINITY_DN34291_c0_g1_i1:45-473(-)